MRYILHYTQPGDIIFDGFGGTGMTGVAAQICETPDSKTQHEIQIDFKKIGLLEPSWGNRRAICGDLSPIASLIANNYNSPVSVICFQKEALEVLKQVENEFGWVYETRDANGIGKINYIIWSEVFLCPNCNNDITFYETAIDHNLGRQSQQFSATVMVI